MRAQDHIEQTMRKIHLMMANAQTMPDDENMVILNKQELLRNMDEINKCIQEMEDVYEVTQQAQESARIRTQKKCDRMLKDTKRTSDDIYAASLLYMEDAMKMLYRRMETFQQEMRNSEMAFSRDIDRRLERIVANNTQLKRQLQKTIDDKTYEQILQEAREKYGYGDQDEDDGGVPDEPAEDPLAWNKGPEPAPEKANVKVNSRYAVDEQKRQLRNRTKASGEPEVRVNYNAAYFRQKKAEEKQEK